MHRKTTEAGGSDRALKRDQGLSGRRWLNEDLQVEDHTIVRYRAAVFPGPDLHTSSFSNACLVPPGVLSSCASCAAVETVDEVERHRKPGAENWR